MPKKLPDEKRILDYVNGLLYYYGILDFDILYSMVSGNIPLESGLVLEPHILAAILNEEACVEGITKDSPYQFVYDEGLFIHFDVEDAEWVLDELEERDDIPYRPVSEKEARLVTEAKFPSLWPDAVQELYRHLQKKYGYTRREALEIIIDSQDMLRNNLPPGELIEDLIAEKDFQGLEELQGLIHLVNEMANHTPLWILKGWTPHEIQHQQHKSTSRMGNFPLQPGKGPGEKEQKNTVPKVGRNEPCPCGSEKKYKKCCGAPVQEEQEANEYGVELPDISGARVTAPAGKENPGREEPTREEWSALFAAVDVFKKAKCWEWMYDDDTFGVMDPETGEIAYCCIMGYLGEHYALGAYLGAAGLKWIFDMQVLEKDEADPELFFKQHGLMASFEDRNDLLDEDRALIKELGLKYRGKKQWPLFRSYEPGLYPWFLSSWQCRFLTRILQQALEVSLRCREDETVLEKTGEDTFLVRVPREAGETGGASGGRGARGAPGVREEDAEEGPGIVWEDQYLHVVLSHEEYASFHVVDELLLKRTLSSGNKRRGTWEVDTFYLPLPIQEKKDSRPYYPKVFLVLDKTSGLILRHETIQDLQEEGYRCIHAIVELVSEKGKIPARIAVERDETFFLLRDACLQMNIELEKVRGLEVMPEIREALFNRNW